MKYLHQEVFCSNKTRELVLKHEKGLFVCFLKEFHEELKVTKLNQYNI